MAYDDEKNEPSNVERPDDETSRAEEYFRQAESPRIEEPRVQEPRSQERRVEEERGEEQSVEEPRIAEQRIEERRKEEPRLERRPKQPPQERKQEQPRQEQPKREKQEKQEAKEKQNKQDRPQPKPAEAQHPHIELKKLTVTFGKQKVLRNISLSIPKGQTVAIIGESGCGKTVLMKCAIGLIKPTSGQAIFDGTDLAAIDDRQLSAERVRFGFVFQNAALFDSMTIGQNVAFPLRQQGGHTDDEVRQQVLDRLQEVGLPKSVVYKRPAELSGGMRKRVGLARALILNPEVVLYDEPTTGLDPIMSDIINELMMRTRRNHVVTSLIVTHDMRTARKVADRVIMTYPLARLGPDEPQVVFDGHPSELDRADRRVLQFVNGEAGDRMNELNEANDR
jgi:phospholipid/cholesterol/gamma-HCH transport system ATP-binding protein